MNIAEERQARSTKPVEIEQSQLDELKESEKFLTKDAAELLDDWDKELVVDASGRILQGIYWIDGDFTSNFWSGRRKVQKPVQCICSTCGSKHKSKIGGAA